MAKKYLMTLIWRITQTGPILSLFFWSTALAGIFWPILGSTSPPGPLYQFLRWAGVSAERSTVVGLLLLFLIFAVTILFIGFVYDRVFKLWREQTVIAMDRNPYADDLLLRKEILSWRLYYLPLAKALYKVSPDPELKKTIDRVETWIVTGKMTEK